MFQTYSEELDCIRHEAMKHVQEWADRLVGVEVCIKRETGSLLAKGKVKKAEAVGLNVKFVFEDDMWCTMPSGSGYTIEKTL